MSEDQNPPVEPAADEEPPTVRTVAEPGPGPAAEDEPPTVRTVVGEQSRHPAPQAPEPAVAAPAADARPADIPPADATAGTVPQQPAHLPPASAAAPPPPQWVGPPSQGAPQGPPQGPPTPPMPMPMPYPGIAPPPHQAAAGFGAFRGIRLVAGHEFRMRLRTGRWKWLLGSWVVVLLVFTILLDSSLHNSHDYVGYSGFVDRSPVGPQLFGVLMLFVLGLMMLISPALTSQSINGDRERGTLATLQVTLLSPREIALGKLLAGWTVGLVALGLTVPFVIWSLIEGGVGVPRALAVLVVVALLIGVVCAVSQALSALLARSITSGLLSYVATFVLTVGTLIAFALAVSITTTQETYAYGDYNGTTNRSHSEDVWWLMAPNPFVILADAAPALPPLHDPQTGKAVGRPSDPLGDMRDGIRRERRGTDDRPCYDSETTSDGYYQNPPSLPQCSPPDDSPVWPWGLGFDLLLGAGAVWVTTRRLRSPADRLGRGVRVA